MIDNGQGDYQSGVGASIGKTAAKITKPRPLARAANRVGTSHTSRRSSNRSSGGSSRGYGGGSSGGGGGKSYSGGGGGGGGGRSSAPKAPSLASYLSGDATYQNELSGQKRTLGDFLSELNRRRGEAGTQFNQTVGSMNRDRDSQLEALRNEFASRGLIQSGLYGEKQGEFQQKFGEQMTALQQQQTGLLNDLLGQEKNYRRENDLTLQRAKQDALSRRAAQYG